VARRDARAPDGDDDAHHDADPRAAGASVVPRVAFRRSGGEVRAEHHAVGPPRRRREHEGQTLRTLNAGDVVGEAAFLGDGHRSTDVIAETDVRVLAMFGTRFREMQMWMPEIATRLEQLVKEGNAGSAEG
jgi:hypothetical protein